MAYDRREGREPVYAAVRRFVDEHLRADGSLFRDGERIVTAENLVALDERFRGRPDVSGDSFLTKFERQLAEAPAEVVVLAAELLYVHLLFAADIGGPSKRKTLSTVLSWLDGPTEIPRDLDAALDAGFANTGIAFKTFRPHQLWFLIDALLAWKRLTAEERGHLLEDPWRFKAFVFALPITSAFTQREALLHLVHPEHFEAIASREHKQRIVEAFADRIDALTGDVDRDLLSVRRSLEVERPDFRWFYEPGVVEAWRGAEVGEQTERSAGTARAWLVRNKIGGGVSLLQDWLEEGYAAIGWAELGSEALGASRESLTGLMARTYPDHPVGRLRNSVGNVSRFLHQMRPGDLIVTSDGDAIHVGVVDSGPEHVPDSEQAFRRQVEWANPGRPISRSDLPASAYSKLRTLLTVSDVTGDIADFADLVGIELESAEVPTPPRTVRTGVVLPDADDDLARSLLLEQEWLQEVIELLRSKRQLIFYGPPGTGKTYVAQRLADHLTKRGGNFTLVQFHPSYAYEDFFEGFRPRPSETAGGVSFELVPGPLRRIAEQAAEDPDNVYLLLVDEINRANLAKVFGEMYFLLEYREAAISLQYSPEEEFTLPKNLYMIGTMNTADRSIARIDAAMRRRFLFVPFFPERRPVAGLLDRWLRREGLDRTPAQLLDELNRRIDDPDAAVGPSYLMSAEAAQTSGLERIWRHSILPLLEEHFLGTGVPVEDRFGLEALLASISRDSETEASASVDAGSQDGRTDR